MIGFGITSLLRTTLEIAVPQLIYKIKGIAEVNATKYTKAVKFCRLYLNINRIKVKIDLILHNCAANLSDNKCGHQEAPQNGRIV